MKLEISELENFRQKSDTTADTLIKNLHEEMGSNLIWKLYNNLINDLEEINIQNLPKTLNAFFIENQKIPSWADYNLIAISERLFLEIGPLYSACLLCRALPIGYSSLKTVKVLTATGYLSKDVKEGTAKRLLETTQFIFNVMEEGTFCANSKGIKHILKVRFLHAMIRYHLLKHNWAVNKYDIPINQEDMAGTILTFSVGAMKGLEKINVKLSPKEKDAITHYWSVVGYIIGVDEKLLPHNYTEGEKLYETILSHQAAYSTDGEELTRALCNFIRGFLPIKPLNDFPEYLVNYLIDNPKYSHLIGVKHPEKMDKLIFCLLISYFKFINKHRKKRLFANLIQKSNNIFAAQLITYFSQEFDLKLSIPQKIQASWGLKYS
ncbi:MAG: oxygenase MpaB family protein [Chitinophagales bacterium]